MYKRKAHRSSSIPSMHLHRIPSAQCTAPRKTRSTNVQKATFVAFSVFGRVNENIDKIGKIMI